jgi:DNA invertase Pin-like site-specific DNA recombinase
MPVTSHLEPAEASRPADGRYQAALERGVKFGRKPILTEPVVAGVRALRADGVTVPEIMRRTHLSKANVYRALGGATA